MGKKKRPGLPKGISYADYMGIKQRATQEALEKAKDDYTKALSDRQAQREYWLAILVLHDRFGFGAERAAQFEEGMKEAHEEYAALMEAGEQEYADAKLQKAVSEITKKDTELLYEDISPSTKGASSLFSLLREDDSRIRQKR